MSAKTHAAVSLVSPHTLDTVQVPIPTPGVGEVLVKTHYAGFSAFDGHQVDDNLYVQDYPVVLGLNASGTIAAVGTDVTDLKEGDEVAFYSTPYGTRTMQEYVLSPSHRITKLPTGFTLLDGAGVNDNFITAWLGLGNCAGLKLPLDMPSKETLDSESASTPILIFGAGTSVGYYALQILKYAGYTNVITTASPRSAAQAQVLGATHVVDYSAPDVAAKIAAAAGGEPIKHVLNVVGTEASLKQTAEVVWEPGSKVALVSPVKIGVHGVNERGAQMFGTLPEEHNPFTKGVEVVMVFSPAYQEDPALKENLPKRIIPGLLATGDIKAQTSHLFKSGSLAERAERAAEAVRQGKLGGARAVIDFTA